MEPRASQAVAVMLILLGALFLVLNLVPGVGGFEHWWPLLVLIPGLVFLLPVGLATSPDERGRLAGLLIPGLIITTVGLILLYANQTGRWEVWAYAWALIPAAVGLGLYLGAQFGNWANTTAVIGRWLFWSGIVAFLALGLLFEGFFFQGTGGVVLALLLIGVGLCVLVGGRRRGGLWP